MYCIFISNFIQVVGASNSSLTVSSTGNIVYGQYETITVNPSMEIGVNNWTPGFQLDGQDINYWITSNELQALSQDASYKFVRFFEHRMGKPCSYWNEATKSGTWDWSKIDSLVREIYAIGAEPMIVLGFYSWTLNQVSSAPSGMSHNPVSGLPYPDQWGSYCAAWVQHFEDVGLPVKYYEILNEPYHYFEWPADTDMLGWYMELYNAASQEMRQINSDVKLGNDASIFKKVLNSFITEGEPLGFISFHMYGLDSRTSSTSQALAAAETRWLSESQNMWAPEQAAAVYYESTGIELPIIMSEGNLCDDYDPCDSRMFTMVGTIYSTLAMRTFILRGYSSSVHYHFACAGDHFGLVNVYTAKPGYTYFAQKLLGNNIAPGDTLVQTSSSTNDIRSLAWENNGKLNLLIIHKATTSKSVLVQGLNGEVFYQKIDEAIPWNNAQIQEGISSSSLFNLAGYTVLLLQCDASGSPEPPAPEPPAPEPPEDSTIYENGYESGGLSQWSGTFTTDGDYADASNTNPFSGQYHGMYSTNGGGWEDAYSYISINEEEVYVRGYFYIADGLPLNDNSDRFYFIRLKAQNEWLAGIGLRLENNECNWVLYARNGADWIGPYLTTSPAIQEGQWYSIELHWKNSNDGPIDVFINGQKIIGVVSIDTSYFGNVDTVEIGISPSVNIQNGLTMYADNIKVSTEYIGP